MPGIFFSFAERKKELRIKTLARLSGIENKEIRRGSAYLLHWYGMPKAQHTEPRASAAQLGQAQEIGGRSQDLVGFNLSH